MYEDLIDHVNKSKKSYKDLCEYYANIKSVSQGGIPHGDGDFIIAACRIFMNIPIVIVKPKHDDKTKKYTFENIYCLEEDANLDNSDFPIVLVWNGLNYYGPALEKDLCDVSNKVSTMKGSISTALEKAQEAINMLPSSDCKDNISRSAVFMRAARECLRNTAVTTGTADLTATQSAPFPVPCTPGAKATRKRACLRRHDHSKRKKSKESQDKEGDNEEDEGEEDQEDDTDSDTETNYTGRADNQCCCGTEFDSEEKLELHVKSVHLSVNSWNCSGYQKKDKKTGALVDCHDTFKKREELWKHVRKVHLGIYRYHCSLKLPSGQKCDRKIEERACWLYHKEVKHNIGKSPYRCRHCKKVIPQINKIKGHESICPESGVEKSEKLIECKYCNEKSFRSRQTYLNHLGTKHSAESGVKARRYHCNVCGRTYANNSALRNHACRAIGTKR